MDSKRRSVAHYLAMFACSIACAVGSGAWATTSTLATNGAFAYGVSGNQVVLTAGAIQNVTVPPQISGELALELWAFQVPFFGLQQVDYQAQGYRLASYPLGRLYPGSLLLNIVSPPVPYTPPPAGTWYLATFVTEYDASAINANGLSPRAFFNYPTPLVVQPPANQITPEAGLWWDPAQNGTGYTIYVKHGVLIVTVYSYRPDGTAVWYLSSGALTNGGHSYSGTLDLYGGGPCISCAQSTAPTPLGNVSTIAIEFASPTSATVYLPGGRVAHIAPADF